MFIYVYMYIFICNYISMYVLYNMQTHYMER